ncbi:dihydroorotate dehydrogenase electron transfer subunit [Natronospira proteinivora]|uniref:Dihydroorotate dehydrogenase electron transfer subunit n=1 Tax=Natronospira proteinivora TaxID=1807133 RepID=A0ABT1GAQ7_9GAMM|nr:dihydroorotate dehydrogenase electron transfer subunit [Natronospira proteinivora]MCP1728398.1 dihydroorotate dehydrogenase electron transfer subunit [Natronospira proteinivora]
MTTHPEHRGSIFVEDAEILAHSRHPAEQYVLRFQAPETARRAEPGSFVHIRCSDALAMRRPLSIMRVDAEAGWVECLYKVVGKGTQLLAGQKVGDTLSVMGPIGQPFKPRPDRRRPLLIGGGVGIPPMVFLADRMRRDEALKPFAILGSEVPFPFKPHPSTLLMPGIPEGVIATMPLLEDWNIPCRLASGAGFAGCHEGFVTELADHWLNSLAPEEHAQVEIHACGPTPMLAATARLAQKHGLPCQVALEEYMACAVGGCAGCVVQVETEQGPAMKRVCVDGPVFEANSVFPPDQPANKAGLFH